MPWRAILRLMWRPDRLMEVFTLHQEIEALKTEYTSLYNHVARVTGDVVHAAKVTAHIRELITLKELRRKVLLHPECFTEKD